LRNENEILVSEMLIQLNQKQSKLKDELLEYFEGLITPALKAELNNPEHFEGGGPEFKALCKQWAKTVG
jgi:hypothetical protein